MNKNENMNTKEKQIVDAAFLVAKDATDEHICEKLDISQVRLNMLKKNGFYEEIMRAHQHNLKVDKDIEKLTFRQALATLCLACLIHNKRPRPQLWELLDVVLDGEEDSDTFLKRYENRHNIFWEVAV